MESILIIRESDYESKEEALGRIAEELNFPEYFGMNLDALFDCLRDVDEPLNVALDPSDDWFFGICEAFRDAAAENGNINLYCAYRD